MPKPACRMSERGVGRFHLGDTVSWQASKMGYIHKGKIVEVVNYGRYPRLCPNHDQIAKVRAIKDSDIVWRELTKTGFWRDYESYVVEDRTGRRWWPRVGNLIKWERDYE